MVSIRSPWNRDGDYDAVVMSEKVSFGMSDKSSEVYQVSTEISVLTKHSIWY